MEETTCEMKEPIDEMKGSIDVTKINESMLMAADQNKGLPDNATVDKEVLKIGINKLIIMLKDTETHKKGEVFPIKGLSNAGLNWQLNKGKFIRVSARGYLYDFLRLTNNDAIEETTSEKKEASKMTGTEYKAMLEEVFKLSINKQIVMLEEGETLKKGDVFTVHGQSNSGKSWRLNNGSFVLVDAKGTQYEFLLLTKNDKMGQTTCKMKEPIDVTNINKSMLMAADQNKGMLENATVDKEVLQLGINKLIIMLKDTETHKKGEVFTIKALSGLNWQLNKGKCIRVDARGYLYDFMHSKNYRIEETASENKEENKMTVVEYKAMAEEVLKLSINKQIVMLEDNGRTLKKGEVFTIQGQSNTGKTWRLNNGKLILVDAKGSQYEFLPLTKNDEMEETSCGNKEPTDISKINKSMLTNPHENETMSKEVLRLSINKQIVMLEDKGETLKKGEVFTIHSVSNSGKTWGLNNGKFVHVDAIGSLFDFLTPTKNAKIEKKESIDTLKINKDVRLAVHETNESVDTTEITKMQNVPPSCPSKNEVVNGNRNIDETEVLKIAEINPAQNSIKVNLEDIVPELVTSILAAKSKVQEIVSSGRCTFDCEGVNLSATGELTLIQAAYMYMGKVRCVIFDVKELCKNSKSDIDFLKPLLGGIVQKVCHDVHMDAAAIKHQFGITLSNVIDTQLVFEYLSGKMMGGMSEFLRWCQVHDHPNKNEVRRILDVDPTIWGKRPLSPKLVKYAAYDVLCLLTTVESWMPQLTDNDSDVILMASKSRCDLDPLEAGKRLIGFGKLFKVEGEVMHSWELLQALEPNLINTFAQVKVDENVHDLMAYIPEKFHDFFNASNEKLRDIVFEVGARPYAYYGPQKRVFLNNDPFLVMTLQQMESIVSLFEGSFSSDNRAGIDRSLHRISAMRSNSDKVYSLTYRVGRAVYGNTGMMKDILAQNGKSVLIMGIPGTGKTTIIREVAKQLADQEFNVIIVDTSNEIAGDGLIPHPSVGMARRMMVPSLDKQAGVLVEAVQNHTPDVIICDEIGRTEEVVAMQTVKERGVRCIASAHGTLRNLVNNRLLNGLVGGIETITVGDLQATKDQHRLGGPFSKVRQQRSGTPVFDVIVELQPKKMDEWTVIADVATAVDRILQGKTFNAQVRRRDPESGLMSLELVQG